MMIKDKKYVLLNVLFFYCSIWGLIITSINFQSANADAKDAHKKKDLLLIGTIVPPIVLVILLAIFYSYKRKQKYEGKFVKHGFFIVPNFLKLVAFNRLIPNKENLDDINSR